ncbi:phosphotransferase family protein [Microbacterium sp. bgisy203]|uniref:phosphotransferase family protein n=1 Tax=Microbacterium sp. bgisy203 TaxID=3413799 RepID=UPI003D762200
MTDQSTVQGGRNRLTWADCPPEVRARIESLCGSSVVSAVTSFGGFSPGLASTLVLADGRTVFAKAASTDTSDRARDLYRRERDILGLLPRQVPHADLLASSEFDDWIVLLYAHIEGRHPVPGDAADRAAMFDTYAALSELLDPSPIDLPPFEEVSAGSLDAWSRAGADAPAARLDPWIADHIDAVIGYSRSWRETVHGSALVHGDLRADNMMLASDGMIVLDWPEASIGAPWLDVVLALPSMAMFSGTPPIEEMGRQPMLRAVDASALRSVVAAMTGFFLCASTEPVIPQLPTLRGFQREQGLRAAAWLRALSE